MDVFVCEGCGAELTGPVEEGVLPVHARQRVGHDLLPALMDPGTYAVDPEPFGAPWRPWAELGPEEAAERGVFAPVPALSDGPVGTVVLAPGDVRGTVLIPDRCDGYCLGVDGRDGPNLACETCGRAVATRIDDCALWQAVRLAPGEVRRVPGAGRVEAGWDALAAEYACVPLIEPSRTWNAGGDVFDEWWSPRWEAAVGAALVDLLVAAGGERVGFPGGGLLAELFGWALGRLLPAGPPTRTVGLAGPGVDSGADIVVVPRHPRTGEVWRPRRAAEVVPLDARMWLYPALGIVGRESLPVPVSGGMPEGVRWDHPVSERLTHAFRPDREVFLHHLARHPAVREPWLRAVCDRGF
ncbi:hypothetical protein ABZX85_22725 [Streptomyces sp. NPDC004539]|uniref:hypothetical protein n=1 Tax=Streptomyces sp. NPDC004539 TaxID=3154280 RepID=UPI0033A83EE8